ncbi:Six-hairpin glycosidase [Aureobasidium pullulans]|uniref:Six-hairpin glycosidase n=1 Tax=Aureobasidium pullulans TaxID=5580 RepID=A0A4S9X097_AURPU|nr:Six-hairpin glycosidase [Aureobasidium pullulans]
MTPAKLLSLFAAIAAVAQTLQCPQNVHGQASQMMASNIARSQGAAASSSGTGLIELGIFYQALRESIAATNNTADKQAWTAYLHNSTATAIPLFTNATSAIGLPLDRFSIGTEMMRQSHETQSASLLSAISTLQDSLAQEPRNTNGGLWYYDNRDNLTAYRNLSYTDGMYSYPTFAILSAGNGTRQSDAVGPAAVLKQLEILAAICDDGTGLLVHGYDALKAHGWADPETGASPSVWGRSQAWYTLGVLEALEALEALQSATSPVMTLDLKVSYSNMKPLFNSLIKAQIVALERALQINGKYGVWQVVDLPGASINGSRNFIETSASLMTAYSLLRSVRLNILEDTKLRIKAIKAGVGLWENIFETHVTRNANGTLDLSGTSSIASLSPQIVNAKVRYELNFLILPMGNVDSSSQYYFDRPTANNSLIGTSAFILASLELEKLCG